MSPRCAGASQVRPWCRGPLQSDPIAVSRDKVNSEPGGVLSAHIPKPVLYKSHLEPAKHRHRQRSSCRRGPAGAPLRSPALVRHVIIAHMAGPSSQQRTLARAVRSAPSAGLKAVADTVGVTDSTRALLSGVTPRGGCDSLLLGRIAEQMTAKMEAEALRMLPLPYLARVGAQAKGEKLRAAAADAGLAGSLARDSSRSDAPRRCLAQDCASEGTVERSAAASNHNCPTAMLERLVDYATDNRFVAMGLALQSSLRPADARAPRSQRSPSGKR